MRLSKQDWITRWIWCVGTVLIILTGGLYALLIYTVVHFVVKFW